MSQSSGDKVVIAGMALLVAVMAGVIGWEVWRRATPAPKAATTPTSAPAETKPAPKPAPEQQKAPESAPSWERHAG